VIVDSSAVLAILLDEPEHQPFRGAIDSAQRRLMSSVTYLESSIALASRRGDRFFADFDEWIEGAGIEIAPFTAEHARVARLAYARYGKGFHAAGFNFGDCACYALAMVEGEPILYKGDDFSQTDVQSAL
jgi:ribonuclease VapC